MYSIPQAAKDAMYDVNSERSITAEVMFDITDTTAYGDVSGVTTNTESAVSKKAQITDRNRTSTYQLASYEVDRFALNGAFSFPDDVLTNNGEVGYESSVLSDATGAFVGTQPTITVTFNTTHSSAGLTLTFDREQNEYATDFDVAAYNGATLITSVSVVGNTDTIAQPLGQLANYNKIVVTFKKWSKPYRRVRLLEMDFGIVKVYTDEHLVRCSLIEEMDMTSSVVPSAEFSFDVDNTDRAFNILNPSGFYKYLQQRQIITPSLSIAHSGTKTKIPLGQYYLTEWTSNEGSMIATLKGRDILDIMANTMHENLAPVSITLAACAVNIFNKCGITDYYLDPYLSTITTNALVARTDCRTILQMIAIAGTCKVFRSRTGQIRLVKEDAFSTSDDRIDFNNAYAEPEIQLLNIVKTVEVTYWTNLTTSAVTTVNATNVPNGEVLQLTDNTLINSSTHATNVANWVIAQRNGFRAAYDISFRGNPAHELCDIVDIQNSYGPDKQAFITKHDMRYEGYLKVRTEAKGVSV